MKLIHKEPTSKLPETDLLVLFVLEGDKPALPHGVEVAKHAFEGLKGEFRETRLGDADLEIVEGLDEGLRIPGIGHALLDIPVEAILDEGRIGQ